MKGGSDTITKLIEHLHEKIGIRSENNIALSRFLLYLAVTFHRLSQIVSSKDVDKYPTICHWQNAGSHRSTFAESMEEFHDRLLRMANGNKGVQEPVQMLILASVFAPSPATEDDTADTPAFQQIAAPRLSTGSTPREGSKKGSDSVLS